MNFYVESDRRKEITGWFLPDNPSEAPVILAQADDLEAVIHPDTVHPNMVEAGWHETGKVGFTINTRHLPNLPKAIDVRLTEMGSGLTFYVRRKARPYAEGRLFAFDMREGPASPCVRAFAGAYQIAFPMVHDYGQDTRKIFYQLGYAKSVFSCGAPCIRADDPFMTLPGMRRVALLADPLRLMFELVAHDVPADDPDALGIFAERLERLHPEDRALLSEPLTRRMTLLYIDEPLERDALAKALDTIASFDVVGIEEAIGPFIALTAAVCEVDENLYAHVPDPPPFPLARALRRLPDAMELAGRDVDIYDATRDAIIEVHRP